MASSLSVESGENFPSEEGRQRSSEKEQGGCLADEEGADHVQLGESLSAAMDKSREEKKKLRVKSEPKLEVDVDESTESGESGPTNHSEGKDSSKHEESSNFEGKVAVTRSSSRRRLGVQPVTPRLEEPRAVRPNRGMKRRYPGEESDDDKDSARKRSRVRSITKVCRPSTLHQAVTEVASKGKISHSKEWMLRARGARRGRQSEVFVCNVEGCEKSFLDAVALYNHGRVHGDRPYVCHYEGCTKRFSERSKLKRHFLIHTGEKPFICEYEGCGKAFSLDFNLRSHMKTHTGEYHECPHPGCEKRYCQEYKLRAHVCKEHKGNKSNVDGGFICKEDSVISSNDKAFKKKAKAEQLRLQKSKLEKCIDGRKRRIQELNLEIEGETKELTKIEKALRKLVREQEQAELEGCFDQDLSSDNPGEAELGEVYGEEKEVVMFAHKHPTADQGARLMDQVVLIQGATPPLSPSLSSSQQPFLMSRMQLGASSPSFSGPIHFLPYNMSADLCHSTMDNCFFAKQESDRQNSSTLGSLPYRPSDPKAGGASQENCHTSQIISFHEQNSQCEPPVSQLFTCQEQPCLQD